MYKISGLVWRSLIWEVWLIIGPPHPTRYHFELPITMSPTKSSTGWIFIWKKREMIAPNWKLLQRMKIMILIFTWSPVKRCFIIVLIIAYFLVLNIIMMDANVVIIITLIIIFFFISIIIIIVYFNYFLYVSYLNTGRKPRLFFKQMGAKFFFIFFGKKVILSLS